MRGEIQTLRRNDEKSAELGERRQDSNAGLLQRPLQEERAHTQGRKDDCGMDALQSELWPAWVGVSPEGVAVLTGLEEWFQADPATHENLEYGRQ